ncbi:MAG: putative toxin [Candidatus Pacebacteria bacterium]|nr:putative toxin [Candidatus Paceibacterota bacterium]
MHIAKNPLSASGLFRKLAVCVLVFSIFFSPVLTVFAEETANTEATQETVITPEPEVQTETPTVSEETETQVSEENQQAAPPIEPPAPQAPEVDPDPLPPQDSKGLLSPEIDNLTGAFVHTYKIQVPPGRNDMTPDLSLMYNSENQVNDSVVGYGWSVNIPYIERVNRTGTEDLYTTGDVFSSSLSGELVPLGSNLYAPRSEKGDFLRYERVSNGWVVTDKKGVKYTFGANAQARQDNSGNIYKWMLEETRDTNDNFVRYEYTKSAGQIYPSKIFYTGFGTTDGIFEIDFTLGSRPDVVTVYNPAFSVAPASLVTSIVAKINGTNTRKYDLVYLPGHNQNRSLLSSITETGYDESGTPTVLPAMSFDYQTVDDEWSLASWTMPVYPDLRQVGFASATQLVDVNGDNLPDFVYALNNNTSTTNPNAVWLNTGSGWSLASWTFPTFPTGGQVGFHTLNTQLIDLNGDGLPDWIYAYNNNTSTANPNAVWLNNGSGWSSASWTIPTYPSGNQVGFHTVNTQLIDLNGDGLPDWIYAYNNNTSTVNPNTVWLNTGSGWSNASWNMPLYPSGNQVGFHTNTQLVDINGDILPDFIYAFNNNTSTTNPNAVWLNTGSGWTSASWTMPTYLTGNQVGFHYTNKLIDVNADGLVDFIHGYDNNSPTAASPNTVWLNTGIGWTAVSWTMPTYTNGNHVGFAYDTQLTDINGDNLPDWINAYNNNTNTINPNKVWLSTGTGWLLASWTMPTYPNGNQVGFDYDTRLSDLNNDGLPDWIFAYNNSTNITNPNAVWLNTGSKSDYLSTITAPAGGSMSITYKEQPINDKNPITRSPSQSITVVKDITTNDAFGTTGTRQYSYQDGKYQYYSDGHRTLAGFNIVTTTDEVGNVTKTFYHQGNGTDTSNGEYNDIPAKIGQPYRVEERDSSNNLYRLTVNKWDHYNIGTDHDFVKLARQTVLTYDGDSDHADTATEYTYDNTDGSLLTKTEWGRVNAVASDGSFTDTGSDKRTTTNVYAANTTTRVVVPKISTVTDASSTTVKESKYYYDTLSYGSVNKGNQTKVEDWKASTTYINSQKAYNSYGLVTSDTDPRGKVTSYSYDTYNLYPTTVTDPLSHTTQYVYDYSLGKPKQVTDQNSFVYQTVYDGLDRVLTEKIPDSTSPYSPVAKTAYAYTDTSGAVKVQRTDYLDTSTTADTYQYFDGLGRLIQERKEAEASNTFNVSDKAYDARGKTLKESLRYTSTGTARTSPTTTTALYTTYAYDPIGRVLTSTNAVGTTTNAYDDWMTTVTDPAGNMKRYYHDAYENLSAVDEFYATASAYTTNYEWNLNGKLTKITDALGNVRNFTYDGLDRRLTAQDTHAVSDATYGIWTYTYDDAGNIIQTVSPNALTTNYAYNDVNQVTSEDNTATTDTDIAYSYSSCTNGTGKLCSVTMLLGADTSYLYNSRGTVVNEIKVINGNTYTTSTFYDRQGNISSVVYPDMSEIRYTYNTAGLLESVDRREPSARTFTALITNFDYSPTDQVQTQNDANGVTTMNTYAASALYRLTNRLTTNSTRHVQDFAYVYDPVGNITELDDASDTDTAKTATYSYDALYRLTDAVITGTASGGDYTHSFAYDALGNLLSGPAGAYVYAGTGYANPHAATKINSITRTYDNDGNLTSDGTFTHTWNYRDQLVSSTDGSVTANYWYDHEGNRVRYVTGTTDISYPNKYYNDDGTKKTKQVYAGSTLVATIETVTNPTVTVTPYYIHTDHLGSTTAVTDASGAISQQLDYYPFGESRISSGAYNEQRKYVGQIHDNDTGLDYLNARYYKGNVGKFISQDPVFLTIGDEKPTKALSGRDMTSILSDPQSLNSYSYGRNNPITMSDASGKFAGELIFAAAYIAMNAPQITSFLQSLTTPVGQYGLSQAITDAKQGNYPMAILGAVTAGEVPKGKVLGDIAENAAKGRAGELASGIVKNTERIESATGTASYRIPDGLDHSKKSLMEVKNVARLNYTNQMKDFVSYAKDANYSLDLHVRPDTRLSGPLQNALGGVKSTLKNIGNALSGTSE